MFFSSILIGILLCILYDHLSRYDKAAKKLYRQFRDPHPSPEIIPAPENLPLHAYYGIRESEAGKSGFGKLGDLHVRHVGNGAANGHAVRVMVDAAGSTILAFSRIETGTGAVERFEMENWCSDGTFLYSSNDPYVYHLKSPEEILVNKVPGGNLADFIASHFRFMAEHKNKLLPAYDSLQKVIEGIEIQSAMRKEVLKTKEFPIDEEELNLMSNNLNRKANMKIYARLRELRRLEGKERA